MFSKIAHANVERYSNNADIYYAYIYMRGGSGGKRPILTATIHLLATLVLTHGGPRGVIFALCVLTSEGTDCPRVLNILGPPWINY